MDDLFAEGLSRFTWLHRAWCIHSEDAIRPGVKTPKSDPDGFECVDKALSRRDPFRTVTSGDMSCPRVYKGAGLGFEYLNNCQAEAFG